MNEYVDVSEGQLLEGDFEEKNFSDKDLWKVTLKNFYGNRSIFVNTKFRNVTIEGFASFKGADLSKAEFLETVNGLENARFDDDTIVDDVNLDLVARRYPLIARKLKIIRNVGRFKRRHNFLYIVWKISSDCGRGWYYFLFWLIFTGGFFSFIYSLSATHHDNAFLPHLLISVDSLTSRPPNISECIQFSFLTIANFTMPNTYWVSSQTGVWVTTEVWAGLFLIGALVALIATNIAKNE